MRQLLRTTTAVATLALAGPALAQTAPAPAADASDTTAEIIVTAQKRPEKLQEIPVAASVVTSAAIAQEHVTDLSDINKVVPSVEIKGTFNGRVPYGMRGISTNANEGTIGLTSGVNIQVDGVPVPADSFAANTITDVSQIEVLKGPQATLGGRTASAGEINFVTFGPTSTTHFGMDTVLTNDGEQRFDVHVSGPISDTLGFSLSGYDARTPYPVYNLMQNDQSKAYSKGLRAKLRFAPTSDFDVTLMGHYAYTNSTGGNFVYTYITPGAYELGIPLPFLSQAAALGTNYTPHYGNDSYNSPVQVGSRYEDTDGSANINYRLGGLTISSLTSYFYEKLYQSQDLFLNDEYFFNILTGGNAPYFGNTQTQQGYNRQTTEELKAVSDANRPLSFIAGLFYSDTTAQQYILRQIIGNPLSYIVTSNTKTYAAYTRVTDKLTDKISVTGGLRYNHDRIGWQENLLVNFPAGQYGTSGPGIGGFDWNLASSSNKLVGDAALQYHLDPHSMLYASYTRGYKPAAYNTNHTFTAPQATPAATDLPYVTPTKGETIDSFEAGAKLSALGGHLTFDGDLFYTNYHNYQAQLFNNSTGLGSGGIALLVLANAGARTEGAEGEINYRTGNTSLTLSGAYIDAKFKDFPNATCNPDELQAAFLAGGQAGANSCSQNLSGKPLPDSPKFKLNASIEQTVPMEHFNILLGSNLSARTGAVLQADQNSQTYQNGFALLDLSVGVQSKDRKVTATFFVNNVTNHFYYTNLEDFFSSVWGPTPGVGEANAVIGQPARDARRYFGGRLSVDF